MSVVQQLFTERFRPKTLEQLITTPRIRAEIEKGVNQNLLLYSNSPGTGKTTLLKILSKSYPTLYINASSDRGIEVIRETIPKFCSSISLEGGKEQIKIVILEETDYLTEEAFASLRAVIDKYANNVRFFGSCNYIQKIPEPIQSRFNCINFEPINQEEEEYIFSEYKKRVIAILNALKISYTDEILNKFISNDFPDMRSLMNKLQSFHLQGIKELNPSNFNINFDFIELFKICLNKPDKPWDNYKLITSEYSSRIDDAFISLGKDFPLFIKDNFPNKIDKLPQIVIDIANYQYQSRNTIDNVVSLLALIYKLQMTLNN